MPGPDLRVDASVLEVRSARTTRIFPDQGGPEEAPEVGVRASIRVRPERDATRTPTSSRFEKLFLHPDE